MKVCSIMFVIGWGAAAAFGFLAITGAGEAPQGLMVIYELLAAAGFAAGMFSWLRIRRGCLILK